MQSDDDHKVCGVPNDINPQTHEDKSEIIPFLPPSSIRLIEGKGLTGTGQCKCHDCRQKDASNSHAKTIIETERQTSSDLAKQWTSKCRSITIH